MFFPLRFSLLLLLALVPVWTSAQGRTPPNETISIRTSEGTELAFDISPDGKTIVFDLLGQLWLIPARGGKARPLTDGVRDVAEDNDPAFSPDGKRIVFRGERNGRTGLWLLDLASGAVRQLTQLPEPIGEHADAAWSPDGRSIAFTTIVPADLAASRPRRLALMVLDVDSGATREVVISGLERPRVASPVWIRDGKEIAFVVRKTRTERSGRLWSVPASGGQATALTDESIDVQAPVFSPDARRIAFLAKDADRRVQVWTKELEKQPAVRLTNNTDVTATRVRWLPNSNEVLYSADGRMWKTAASGGTPTEIRFTADLQIKRARRSLPPAHFPMAGQTNVPARGFTGLAISPDGRRIAMLALGKLWIIRIGQAAQAVADVPFEASTLAWSPDGGEVAWSAGVADKEDLFATKVDNGATRQLTALPGRESYPVFSPDGRYVAFVHVQGEEGKLRTIDANVNKLADPGQTRDLGSIGSSGTCTPQWSPASDGLLVCGEARPDQLGRATFVPLTGERQTITKFPNGPIFLQWMADDKIFFERHDRLWQSTLDRKNGTASEPQPLGTSAALYLSSSRDGTLVFVSKGGLRLRSPNGQEQELGWPITYSPPVAPPLLIRNVHVIDGTGAPATSARDILIERGRISRIGAANEITPPAGATVLDAAGRFVIPGLIDLHAHVYRPNLLPGWAYFGITTIRDQGSSIGPLVAVADNIASGAMPGPRVAYGGFQFYSDWAFDEEQGRGIEPEADADHIKRSVDLLEAFGAQHIKTRTFRRWDINARMIAEAHSRGLRATGHCSHLLPLIAAGMDAKEHIGGCEARGDKHMYDDMIQLFKAAGIGVVPTVSYLEYGLRVNENPALIEADGEVNPFLPSKESFEGMTMMPAELREVFASGVRNSREGALRLSRAGVTIGTGTDIWLTPVGVHIELEELVKAGLTPAQAIRAGTSDAARILGADNELGTIKIGMVADLVLLDADPLADIRSTRRIWNVIQQGKVIDRPAIVKSVKPK